MKRKPRPKHYVEAVFFSALLRLFRLLPMDAASAFGGWLGQRIGPRLKWARIASHNLQEAFPERSASWHADVLKDMWDNLGRNFAEYAWLNHPKFSSRIQVMPQTLQLLEQLRVEGKATVFAGGHLANWEVLPLAAAGTGNPLVLIYRHANNPLVDAKLLRIRGSFFAALHPKGKRGAMAVIKALQQGQSVGLLVDQKMNDGEPVPFFGRPAMTAIAAAELALKYQVPLVLCRVVRQDGLHFTIEGERVDIPEAASSEEAAVAVMTEVNQRLEAWIREHPAQWLWLHQRWGKVKV